MSTFRYADSICTRYPQIVGGVILARGMRNGPTPPPLLAAYLAEQQATSQRIGASPLSQIEALAAWRWRWRQSETSAVQADTTDALMTVEAHHAGGACTSAILDTAHPEFFG